mmetsp:Transcript_40844/g.44305  ORF Transcript_40844/g.44305 Transcript_40844/m.44305 type:complete len:311 (+) Transcript_40844:222-1154(+)
MELYFCLLAVMVRVVRVDALSKGNHPLSNPLFVSRRSFVYKSFGIVVCYPGIALATAVDKSDMLSKRLDRDILYLPPSLSSELNGIDNLYYPSYLAGEWEVTQTLTDMKAPLGKKYLGGPNGNTEIAEKSINEARSKIGVPVRLKLRYLPTKWGIVEDRLYNNKERLDAFALKSVVASVQYADVGGSNRKSLLAFGGKEDDPLQTAIIYFKGPAAQKIFLTSHGALQSSDTLWIGYEVQRSIFALTNQSTAPPIITDSECIWSFDRIDDDHIRGKLRIAGYLTPQNDAFYFDAQNRAVSLQDYTLDMKRI